MNRRRSPQALRRRLPRCVSDAASRDAADTGLSASARGRLLTQRASIAQPARFRASAFACARSHRLRPQYSVRNGEALSGCFSLLQSRRKVIGPLSGPPSGRDGAACGRTRAVAVTSTAVPIKNWRTRTRAVRRRVTWNDIPSGAAATWTISERLSPQSAAERTAARTPRSGASREESNSGDGHMNGVYLQARPGVPKSQQVVSDNRCRTCRQYHARDNNPGPSR